MYMNKSRRICIITGSGSGIGLATAIEMAKRGFDLICVGRNMDKLDTAKDEIKVVITLGAVIKGETDHYHYISEAVTNGIMKITLESNIPVIFGVLTCQTLELAQKRSSIQNMSCNKGYEAGEVALSMINTKK